MTVKAKQKVKTQTLKLNISPEDLLRIDEAKEMSGHKTRTDYMVDSALSGAPVYLHDIAKQIGRLGQICNDFLVPDEDLIHGAHLQGDDAKRAVRKIIKTCDAVVAALRR
jgi:hypothetical protein